MVLPGYAALPRRLRAPAPGWTTRIRRRGHRLRHRRRDRGAADPGRARAGRWHGPPGHQGRARRRVDPVGAGRHRRGARPGGHPGAARAGHPRRGRRRLRPRRRTRPGHRGSRSGPRADRARHPLRPHACGRAVADPRGRAPPRPDRARRRRRDRRRDHAGADRGRRGRARHRGHPARAGRRPAARRRRRRRRRDPARDGRGPARRGRRGPVPGGGAGQRRAGPGLRAVDQPGRVHRRRHGAGAAGRRDAARPGVRPVPPDRDVAGPGVARTAAADLRGGPRRGRLPRRLRGQPLHAGRARARRPGAARRGGQGDHPPDGRDRPAAHVAGRPAPGWRSSGSAGSPPSSPPRGSTASTR